MKRILLMTAALIVAGTMASAAITAQSLVDTFKAQGYTRIEVKTGLTQIKLEAVKGTTKVETIYDMATGQALKTETEAVGVFDDTAPGVELSNRNRDFLRLASNDDDSNDDDDDSDDDSDDDDSDDDSDDNSGHGGGNSGHGSDD